MELLRLGLPWLKHKPTVDMAAIWTFSLSTGVGPGDKGTPTREPQLLSPPFNLLSRRWAQSVLARLTQDRWGAEWGWQQPPQTRRTEQVGCWPGLGE